MHLDTARGNGAPRFAKRNEMRRAKYIAASSSFIFAASSS